MTSAIYHDVERAPFKIGNRVIICCRADETIDELKIGKAGVVECFDYEGGVGETYPHDPMIGVRFEDNSIGLFWREEMKLVKAARSGGCEING